jgi:hypothetical protein
MRARTERVFAAALLAALLLAGLAPPALAQTHQPIGCDRDDTRCRWWRPLGGFRRHQRDFVLRLSTGFWSHDQTSQFLGVLDVAGVLMSESWAGGSVGLTGSARVGGVELGLGSPTMGFGAYVGSRMEGTRLEIDARFSVAGESLFSQSDAQARAILLTGLALGDTADPFWAARVAGGWAIRMRLANRFPLPGFWNAWLNVEGSFGAVRIATDSARALGGLAARETTIGGATIELFFGDACVGYRFGARATLGIGATVPSEMLFPIHADLVLGWEPDQAFQIELLAGFTAIPIGALLYPDTTFEAPAMPSGMLRLTFFPVASIVPRSTNDR